MEYGETVEQAVRREMQEEVGLTPWAKRKGVMRPSNYKGSLPNATLSVTHTVCASHFLQNREA